MNEGGSVVLSEWEGLILSLSLMYSEEGRSIYSSERVFSLVETWLEVLHKCFIKIKPACVDTKCFVFRSGQNWASTCFFF